jgi:glycosyltransferase involved in cell wall biosynthesis
VGVELTQNKIRLSICIPTYNRKDFLRQTLDSICLQDIFQDTHYVEVVISDNNSSDGTKDLCGEYVVKYGSKIRYFYNNESVRSDENFFIALSKGSGSLLKLNNDTLCHKPGSLIKILELIESSIQSRRTLFFLNGKKYGNKVTYCKGVEDLVLTCSFWTTWIGGFSVWRDQLWELDDFSRYSSLRLVQVDALFRLVSSNGVVVYNQRIFSSASIEQKEESLKQYWLVNSGYNLFVVFLENYSYILSEYINRNMISHRVVNLEKRKVLIKLICPWVAKSIHGDKSNFNTELHLEQVKKHFDDKKIIFYYLFRLKLFGVAIIIIKFIRRLLK